MCIYGYWKTLLWKILIWFPPSIVFSRIWHSASSIHLFFNQYLVPVQRKCAVHTIWPHRRDRKLSNSRGCSELLLNRTLPIAVFIILKLGTIKLITNSPHSIFSLTANKSHAITNLLTNIPCICQPCHAPLSSLSWISVHHSYKKKVCGVLEAVWYFLFLTFEGSPFVANMKKSFLEIHFVYLSRKRLRFVLQTHCIISILFYTKCHLFHNFFFLCSNHTDFFITCALKFKYQPVHLKVVRRK
jgi:hypothetical protein